MTPNSVLDSLPARARQIIDKAPGRDACLQQIARLLADEVPVYDWVGFYLAAPDGKAELHLGPYVGAATEHTIIPFGKGICGQVAESHQTFVVDDVEAEDNYLSCNMHVKSEIVVPIMKGERFVAQLDIDSNTKAAMDAHHRATLERICGMLEPLFD
ncbi:MAG: GAF domain-containing protein [Cyclonatronaceae bacterium]